MASWLKSIKEIDWDYKSRINWFHFVNWTFGSGFKLTLQTQQQSAIQPQKTSPSLQPHFTPALLCSASVILPSILHHWASPGLYYTEMPTIVRRIQAYYWFQSAYYSLSSPPPPPPSPSASLVFTGLQQRKPLHRKKKSVRDAFRLCCCVEKKGKQGEPPSSERCVWSSADCKYFCSFSLLFIYFFCLNEPNYNFHLPPHSAVVEHAQIVSLCAFLDHLICKMETRDVGCRCKCSSFLIAIKWCKNPLCAWLTEKLGNFGRVVEHEHHSVCME